MESINHKGVRNETDRHALLDFKAKIKDDPFMVLSSWKDTTPFLMPSITPFLMPSITPLRKTYWVSQVLFQCPQPLPF
jgi:hypothetical protein